MATSERADPYLNSRFVVEIDSLLTTGFSEVRGLAVSAEESTEGSTDSDVPAWKRILERDMTWGAATSSRTDSPTLKLRRGVTDSSELWEWFRDWNTGIGKPADARVILLDSAGREARGWLCKQARPVRWSGPTLVATESSVAMETFELAHDGIETLGLDE